MRGKGIIEKATWYLCNFLPIYSPLTSICLITLPYATQLTLFPSHSPQKKRLYLINCPLDLLFHWVSRGIFPRGSFNLANKFNEALHPFCCTHLRRIFTHILSAKRTRVELNYYGHGTWHLENRITPKIDTLGGKVRGGRVWVHCWYFPPNTKLVLNHPLLLQYTKLTCNPSIHNFQDNILTHPGVINSHSNFRKHIYYRSPHHPQIEIMSYDSFGPLNCPEGQFLFSTKLYLFMWTNIATRSSSQLLWQIYCVWNLREKSINFLCNKSNKLKSYYNL